MPWNEPGGNKDKDPWSNKPSRGNSSDGIEDAIQKMNDKLGQLFGGCDSVNITEQQCLAFIGTCLTPLTQ